MVAKEVTLGPHGLTFPLAGVEVTGLRVGSHVLLQLGDDIELVIESPFILCRDDQVLEINVSAPSDTAMVSSVLHQTIRTVIATRLGNLQIAFEDGQRLEVAPYRRRESWRFHFSDGRMYWCLQDGGVGMFDHSFGGSIRNLGDMV